MTTEERDAMLADLLLEAIHVMRELRDAVRVLNARLAVQDARESQVSDA